MRKRSDLRAYQRAAIEFIKRVKRCALFVDPGLGKTGTTLTAIADLVEELELKRVLVVAPPHVSRKTWPDEIMEWEQTRDLSYVVLRGSPKKRAELLKRDVCVHLMSIDLLPWLLDAVGGQAARKDRVDKETGDIIQHGTDGWRAPKNLPYDAIIVDESSKLKQYNTNRWKAMKQLAFKAPYFIELTGTPSPQGMEDLWSQVYLLDRGERLGRNITAFRNRWFDPSYDGSGFHIKGDYVVKIIEKRIADVVFTLREEDYLTLPPRMFQDVKLDMEDAMLTTYKKFEKKLVLEAINGKVIRALDGASLTSKLLQLANGVVYDEIKGEHVFHDLKIQALESLVDETGGAPLLVAYGFKSDAARILKKFPKAKLFDGKTKTLDAWNRGEISMLLAHPQSVAHGLNLQHGGNHAVWYTLPWSLEQYLQFNKRLHRSGQTKPVFIHHLIMTGTMDEDVLEALGQKNATQETLLNSLKKRIEIYK